MHSHPRYHIYAIISSVVITDWPCVATYQIYFVWSARRCLETHWLRAVQSHFGTAPAPGHVRQVNNLVLWVDDATAQWSDTLRIRPVRWRKWNRIRIDLARLADPIPCNPSIQRPNIFQFLSVWMFLIGLIVCQLLFYRCVFQTLQYKPSCYTSHNTVQRPVLPGITNYCSNFHTPSQYAERCDTGVLVLQDRPPATALTITM